MKIELSEKQRLLVKDILTEAMAVSQQLIKHVPPSQVSRFRKQVKDIRKVLPRFTVV